MPGVIKSRLSAGIPLEGTLAREPDDVAREIVDSVRTRRPEVVIPRVFGPLVPLYGLAPRRLVRGFITAMHPERIVTQVDDRIRGGYEQAIRDQGARS
jgi:hypothetical protein